MKECGIVRCLNGLVAEQKPPSSLPSSLTYAIVQFTVSTQPLLLNYLEWSIFDPFSFFLSSFLISFSPSLLVFTKRVRFSSIFDDTLGAVWSVGRRLRSNQSKSQRMALICGDCPPKLSNTNVQCKILLFHEFRMDEGSNYTQMLLRLEKTWEIINSVSFFMSILKDDIFHI